LTSENAESLFNNVNRGKLYYLFKGDKEERKQIVELVMQMHDSNLPLQPILIDCQPVNGAENPSLAAFKSTYLSRFPNRVKDLDKFINENILGLGNKFMDVWFWDQEVFKTISQMYMSVVTFFQGPTVITQEKSLMFAQGIEGTFNIVTYMPQSSTERAAVDQLKSFRMLN
jgi:hypothetical protein